MNNKPVAWIIQDKYGRPALSWKGNPISYSAISVEQEDIPLYTHPHPDNLGLALSIIDQQKLEIERLKAKTLTDEEINKLWAKSSEDGIAMQQGFTTQQHYFANLILKKASEK